MNRIDQIRELLSGISSESLADVLRERGYEVRPKTADLLPLIFQHPTPEEFEALCTSIGIRPHNGCKCIIIPASDIIEAMSGDETTAAQTAEPSGAEPGKGEE